MTAAGWLFMIVSWAALIVLTVGCFRKILRGKW
jgi:hypothetical protein